MAAAQTSGIYQDLMRFKPDDLTPNAWAVKAGVSRTVWADMRRHGNPSRRTLEKLLVAAGSSLAEFEALRVADSGAVQGSAAGSVDDRRAANWAGAQLPPLPLIASGSGGEWGSPASRIDATELRAGEVLERVQRPLTLANDSAAYALIIVGNSMWPRFRAGRRIAVSPASAPQVGDDVVVKLNRRPDAGKDTNGITFVLIKELVRSDRAGVDLRQFNPDVTFRVQRADIVAIEKVVGELL